MFFVLCPFTAINRLRANDENRRFVGFVAAINRVTTYRKRGKIGFLGCVDVGEKL